MESYTDLLLETCATNLQLSLTTNYITLQEETLALLSCIAQLIQEKFEKYYGQFMPGLKSILANTPNDTQSQKNLKSNTIQSIGFLLEAVKEQREQFEEDAKEILGAFIQLLQPGQLKEDDPQVQTIVQTLP